MERASDPPGASSASSRGDAGSALVAWLRAPAFSPNVLSRPMGKGALARLTLAPLLFVALAGLAVLLVRTTEIYVVNGGVGDDGVIYAAVVRAYDGHIQALGLNGYTAQRCLNPILVRLGMNVFRMSTDTLSIITAYKVANAISIMVAVACGIASARHLRLSRAGLLVACLLTYFNFVTLYWLPFDPVLTDGMALAIGSLQLWAYLSRRYVVLAIVSAAGGFIWPSTTQVGAAMLFFPRAPEGEAHASSEVGSPAARSATPSAIDIAIAAVLAAVITWYASSLADYAPPYGQLPAIKTLFRLSCALLCFVSFVALKELVRVGPSLRQLARLDRDALVSKVLAVVMLVGVSRALKWIAAFPTTRIPQAPEFAVSDVLKGAIFFAVQRPLVSIVAHVGYVGPAILIMFFCWRNVCNDARRLGFGLNAALGMAFFMLLNSQSRGAMDLVPIILPLAATAAARLPWTPRRLLELGAIIFVASKLWYSIVQRPHLDFASIMNNVGPWMSQEAYITQGLATVLAGIWFVWMSRQRPPPDQIVWLSEEQPT